MLILLSKYRFIIKHDKKVSINALIKMEKLYLVKD